MSGLIASELDPETLRAGEVIEYYCRAFVCSDPKGYRRAVVTRVNDSEAAEFPIDVDTDELIPRDMMMKRVADGSGHTFQEDETKWRKLRTYQLVAGSFSMPSRASALNAALQGAVTAAVEAAHRAMRETIDEIVPESPQSCEGGSSEPDSDPELGQPSSTSVTVAAPATSGGTSCSTPVEAPPSEETRRRSSISQIINLVSSDEENTAINGGVHATEIEEAAAYVRTIPTRLDRAKIRHQKKKRNGDWHVARSRKRRHQAKCAITRSGTQIYHAKSVKALRIQSLLRLPSVKIALPILHDRRPKFPEHPPKVTRQRLAEVAWPEDIERIETCKTNGVRFKNIGDFDPCDCVGDCFLDVCENVATETFCTPSSCNLKAKCSNAPRTLDTLRLFDTGKVGLGVYTAARLDVGDVIGEYCGELQVFPAVVEGQPASAVKQNSGYTLLYNAKSAKKNFVYVDALTCGSITRFISHSCDPNTAFVEQQNRSRVKVLVKMIKNVKAGAEITVHYGDERWFKCACEECWNEEEKDAESDE